MTSCRVGRWPFVAFGFSQAVMTKCGNVLFISWFCGRQYGKFDEHSMRWHAIL